MMKRIAMPLSLPLRALLAAALFTATTAAVFAQAYPSKPVRLVIPYPPGGATDVTGREISRQLAQIWGQPVVTDNRTGAAGTIGHGVVAKAAPDGYTLVVGTFGGLVSGPALLGERVPYDPVKDFVPVGLAVYTPWLLVAHPSVAAKNVKELIDLAKASPGKLNYGSTGSGTPNHLGMVLLMVNADIQMVHVPYRGAGGATVDLLTGRVHALFSGAPQILPHVKTGKLRAIGVGHSARLNALPDVPTIAESVPGFYNSGYYGLLGPAGLPAPLVQKINADLRKAFSAPEVVARMESQGLVAAPGSPQSFGELIRKDLALWRKVMKSAGITAESAR